MKYLYKFFFITFLITSLNVNSQPATIVGTVTGGAGQTVSISIDYLGTDSGVVGFQVDINFDSANLAIGIDCNASLGDAGIGCVDNGSFVRIIVFGLSNSPLPNGQVGLLNFTISPSVNPPNSFPISISNETYSQAAGVSVPSNGSIDGSILVEQLYSIGGNVSGLNAGSVTLQNNFVDNITLSTDGPFVFPTGLLNTSNYNVKVFSQPVSPNQTCLVSGGKNGDGTGIIDVSEDLTVQVTCNTSPIINNDNYTKLEDEFLITLDVDGTLDNDPNNDGTLANDIDSDVLSIVTPGTYDPISGIGGILTINADGEFLYNSPVNAFGVATFSFEVTDGASVISSELSIEVLPVNDAPTFDILGNIDAVPLILPPNVSLQITNFVSNINLGDLENSQSIQQFNLEVVSDSNGIIEVATASIDAMGSLLMQLTLNEGIALLRLTLMDDGGIINGGEDTSEIVEFSVSYIESIFANDFENVLLFKFINSQKELILENEIISFRGHYIELYNFDNILISLKQLKAWIREIENYQHESF